MFTGEEIHDIGFTEAAEITKRYRDIHTEPEDRKAVYFSKKGIQKVLDQTDCVGIRIYFGYNEEIEFEPIIVGADRYENDILHTGAVCLDLSLPCPDRCSEANILNS
jgi:metal-dependent amidase/aminoacylase/carboxypeptidase family protein